VALQRALAVGDGSRLGPQVPLSDAAAEEEPHAVVRLSCPTSGLSTLSHVGTESMRVTPLGRDDWRSALATAVDAPPAAHPSLADALGRGRAGRADAFLLESPRGAALLPVVRHHRRVGDVVEALPHGLSGGPVTVFGSPPAATPETLCTALGAQRVSVAVHHLQASRHPPGTNTTHVLELSIGRQRPRERVRRKLRAAARAGVEVRQGDGSDVASLLTILGVAADARGSRQYADDAIAPVATCEQGLVLLASQGDRDISAALFLYSPLELFYWLGGTLPGSEDISPSYAVIDAAIEIAAKRECRYVNFGSSDGLTGVAFFKEGFGARRVPNPLLVAETPRYRAIAALRHVLRKLRPARRMHSPPM
jgi:hypothetical protein